MAATIAFVAVSCRVVAQDAGGARGRRDGSSILLRMSRSSERRAALAKRQITGLRRDRQHPRHHRDRLAGRAYHAARRASDVCPDTCATRRRNSLYSQSEGLTPRSDKFSFGPKRAPALARRPRAAKAIPIIAPPPNIRLTAKIRPNAQAAVAGSPTTMNIAKDKSTSPLASIQPHRLDRWRQCSRASMTVTMASSTRKHISNNGRPTMASSGTANMTVAMPIAKIADASDHQIQALSALQGW